MLFISDNRQRRIIMRFSLLARYSHGLSSVCQAHLRYTRIISTSNLTPPVETLLRTHIFINDISDIVCSLCLITNSSVLTPAHLCYEWVGARSSVLAPFQPTRFDCLEQLDSPNTKHFWLKLYSPNTKRWLKGYRRAGANTLELLCVSQSANILYWNPAARHVSLA